MGRSRHGRGAAGPPPRRIGRRPRHGPPGRSRHRHPRRPARVRAPGRRRRSAATPRAAAQLGVPGPGTLRTRSPHLRGGVRTVTSGQRQSDLAPALQHPPQDREADAVQSPTRQHRLVEMCPELSLSSSPARRWPIRRPRPRAEPSVWRCWARCSVRRSWRVMRPVPPAGARSDDVLDAFAGAWTGSGLASRDPHSAGGRARRAWVAHGSRGLTAATMARVPVALFDLDNTLYDREGTFRRWATAYVDGRADPAGEVEWLCQVDGDGMTDRVEMWTRPTSVRPRDPGAGTRGRSPPGVPRHPRTRPTRPAGSRSAPRRGLAYRSGHQRPHAPPSAQGRSPGSPLSRRRLLRLG